MPYIETTASVAISGRKEQAIKERMGQAIELIPGKSEGWLMLQFEDNCRLYFKGDSRKPLAFVNVKLFGSADEAAYARLTAEITRILDETLHIAPDGVYVQYEETRHWGWNGANF